MTFFDRLLKTVIDRSMTVSKGAHYSRVSTKTVIDQSMTFCDRLLKTVIDQSMTVSKGAHYSRVSVESVIDRSMTLFSTQPQNCH